MRMSGKYPLREASEGRWSKLPEKPKLQNKDWLGKEALFHTQEFVVRIAFFFFLTEEIT